MIAYHPPTEDLLFVLEEVAGLDQVAALPGFEEATPDLVQAILTEAGRFAAEVLAPLNRNGDIEGSRRTDDGDVVTPQGWKEAYSAFVDSGWNALAFDPEYGGQGMPWVVATAVQELWHASNMSFGLCPMLTQGAVEALVLHGSDSLKSTYLPKLVSGEWTGTMNLTEPQAGSDLSAVKSRAVPNEDHYLISGQKIFITYGEHDLSDNIIHLVLARTPDAPAGVKGISLFVVPKFIPDENGNPGKRNDVRCASIEHKLGIKASPTAVLAYGDDGGAVGFLVGEENRGLEYMFTMMNVARHAVGVEGYAIADRAFQQALAFSRERVQGRPVGSNGVDRRTIIGHADVRRMLVDMQCRIEAMRSLGCYTAAAMDRAARDPDEKARQTAQYRVEVLTPIVKGWSTESGNEITYQGVQVHGGMGFIEETGAAQHYRDARILPIYEGTTGIQSADLIGRKLIRDQGQMTADLVREIREDIAATAASAPLTSLSAAMTDSVDMLEQVIEWVLKESPENPLLPGAASHAYLQLFGVVAGGWMMCKRATAAQRRIEAGEGDEGTNRARIASALAYANRLLPQCATFRDQAMSGSAAIMEWPDEYFPTL